MCTGQGEARLQVWYTFLTEVLTQTQWLAGQQLYDLSLASALPRLCFHTLDYTIPALVL
jgi:hypothetical protein